MENFSLGDRSSSRNKLIRPFVTPVVYTFRGEPRLSRVPATRLGFDDPEAVKSPRIVETGAETCRARFACPFPTYHLVSRENSVTRDNPKIYRATLGREISAWKRVDENLEKAEK